MNAAQRQLQRPIEAAALNRDEDRYGRKFASYSKGLPHNDVGEVQPHAYAALLKALESGTPHDFEAIPVAGVAKLANPQAAFAFGLEGADCQAFSIAPPPAFASEDQAAEMVELYWQALTRDVPFAEYPSHELTRRAAAELSRLTAFRGPREDGRVTAQSLFRGTSPGETEGPFLSQFLWKDVPWGAVRMVQQIRAPALEVDYLTTWPEWIAVQEGAPNLGESPGDYRYIATGRDLALYTQLDFTYQAFEGACLILLEMKNRMAGRQERSFRTDAGNPYRGSRSQSGFVTFGAPHILDMVSRVAVAALRACWYQKWLLHRRVRPEEFGGRVHAQLAGAASYPIHPLLLRSEALEFTRRRFGSSLLPQAYPEASPLHPSYPAGHAAIAGACATVLKAFFDEDAPIENPVIAREDGLILAPYVDSDLTVGGELNKLAWNISCGRNAAGIHWRSDAVAGIELGEAVALSLLEDMRECFNERFQGFSLKAFSGKQIVV